MIVFYIVQDNEIPSIVTDACVEFSESDPFLFDLWKKWLGNLKPPQLNVLPSQEMNGSAGYFLYFHSFQIYIWQIFLP